MIYLSAKPKTADIGKCAGIGVMLSYRPATPPAPAEYLSRTLWAADNGCFKNPDLDVAAYLAWLEALQPYQSTCLFATAPDVVGDHRATWRRSEQVLPRIRELGFKAALVAQDGIENYPIRWGAFDVLFIGGSTEWKLSEGAFYVARQAKLYGYWAHMGRVNSRRRLRIAEFAGADSADGTHIAYRPDQYLAQTARWLEEIRQQPFLDFSQR